MGHHDGVSVGLIDVYVRSRRERGTDEHSSFSSATTKVSSAALWAMNISEKLSVILEVQRRASLFRFTTWELSPVA